MKLKYAAMVLMGIILVGAGFCGGIYYQKASGQMTQYRYDVANGCSWKNGHLNISTTVAGPQLYFYVKNSNNASFLKTVERLGLCIYKQ